MIKIENKALCTGCGACKAACPTDAITLIEDKEGFRYPVIDELKCIMCGKCESVCSMYKHAEQESVHEGYYAGYLKNTEELSKVSSGGAFWALAQTVLSLEGVVYGAVQRGIEDIRHERADTVEDAEKFRRSKYFQSDVSNCYNQVKDDLNKDKIVLFSGTACQVAALYNYLGKKYDNLYTCDVVCHGVPSMKVFRSYRTELENSQNTQMKELVFRDKSYGWRKNHYKITFENGKVIKEPSVKNLFHAGYLQGIFYRPSCGHCRYAKMPRVSDITLADYWKYEGDLLKNNDMGISLIVCSTEHGEHLLDKARKYMYIENSDREAALLSCRHLNNAPKENPNRQAFFDEFNNKGYKETIKKYLPKRTFIGMIRKKLHGIRKYLGRLVHEKGVR